MTENILNLIKERQKQVRNSKSYRDINEEIDNECQRVKEEWLIQKCVRMEHFSKTNQTNEMRRDIKHFKKKKKQCSKRMYQEQRWNIFLFEKEDINQRWEEFI